MTGNRKHSGHCMVHRRVGHGQGVGKLGTPECTEGVQGTPHRTGLGGEEGSMEDTAWETVCGGKEGNTLEWKGGEWRTLHGAGGAGSEGVCGAQHDVQGYRVAQGSPQGGGEG